MANPLKYLAIGTIKAYAHSKNMYDREIHSGEYSKVKSSDMNNISLHTS